MTDQDFLTKILTDTALTRRSFLKWSAALGGAAVISGGLHYGLREVEAAAQTESGGEWISAACWHNCGGRCVNKAYVVDGVVLRQKTDDSYEDSPDFPQMRGCLRGRSQRQQVFGADRLKYPMKRKNWEPGGGNRELRGRDEWERISWDEALDLVADEITRIKENFGNEAILGSSPVLNAYGGGMGEYGVVSEGAWPLVRQRMAGTDFISAFFAGGLLTGSPDRMSYRKAKLVILWGANPAWSSAGSPMYNYLQAKKAGAKYIVVTPEYNPSAVALAADWIPVRPGTDTALLLAMAHYMITNDLQDQEFLDTYTLGFDEDHMPEGADPKENFKDYVLGTYDNVPKTPEWASEICGTAPEVIRQFAQEIATTKPMIFSSSFAPARTYYGEQFCQAFLTVGWMTGNLGIPGGAVCTAAHSAASYGGPPAVIAGQGGEPANPNPLFTAAGPFGGYGFNTPEATDWTAVAYEERWDAVLNGEWHAGVRGVLPCDIRCLYFIRSDSGGNTLNQSAGIPKGIEAFRKVEFVVTNDIVLSTVSKYADIVLPATTQWEKAGLLGSFANPETLFYFEKVTEPLYEARDEAWMENELAKRWGIDPDTIHPLTPEQKFYNELATSIVMLPDGSGYEPLLTITAEDIAEMGVVGEPQQGRITLQEFKEAGKYQIPRSPDDAFSFVSGYTAMMFRADPEANPANTASGKLEIHCQSLADTIADFGFTTIAPIAQYSPHVEGIEETYDDWENKVKGEYPLQLCTPHYLRRSHSVFDNIRYLRRAFPQEMWINPIDADALGIETDDTVLISSRHGKVLRKAAVSEFVVPGVVQIGEGAWVEWDDETGIDRAGATNTLNGTHLCGQAQEPWNTCNVKVEKWDGDPLEPDYTWPQRVIFEEEA